MAKSFSLEEALGGAPKPAAAPSKGFSLEDALGTRAAKPSGLPAGEDLAALITPAEDQPKPERKVYTGSVFDTQPFDPKFDPVEAEKLSRRAYAEKEQTRPRRTQSVRATPEDQIDRSVGRAIADTGIGLLQGAVSIPKGIASNINAGDNPVAKFYEEAIQAGERSKSPFLRSQSAEREALLKNVLQNQGELAQTRAAFTSMFSPSGADIVSQGAGSMLPVVGMSLLNLGQKSFVAMNALANAGDAAQSTARKLSQMSPEDWSKSDAYQELRSAGLSHADSVRMLAPLMAMPSQLVGGGAGFIAGGTGLEKSLVGGAIRGGSRERAARAGSEALGEQLETLAPSLAGNITQRLIDEKTSPTEGLGREAVETLFGSVPGAALAASGRSAPDAKPELDTSGLAERMARERGFLATETKRPEERTAPVQERVEPTFEPEKLAAEPSAPKQPAQEGKDLSDLDAFIAQLQQPAVETTMEKPAPDVAGVAAPAEETPQEKLKRLSSKSIGMTNAFRDRIITNQEFDKFKSDLEAARQEANQAAPDVSALSPAKQEILEIADKLEAAGLKGVADGMRLAARPKAPEPNEKNMEFYRSKLQPYEEKQAAPESKPYGLPDFFSDNEKEAARITGLMKSGPLKTRVALGEANDSIQRLAGTIQAAGFDINNLIESQVPEGIMKIKRQIGNIAARSNRLAAAAEAVQKKYKRADPARVKSDAAELMADVEEADNLIAEDQNIPSAAEQMEGVAPPVSPEVEELLKKSRLASEDIQILSKRSSGTSLMKVLEGALKDGEMSELGGRSRQIGKNPFISLVAKKGKRGSSMEDMVESGKLNLFLPFGKRSGEPGYDNAESAEYIREKLRTGEYYTDDIRQEIESIQRGIWSIDEEIQQELSLEDINREIQYAADEQRAIDQEAETVAPEGAPEALDEGTREEDEILKSQTKEELKAKQNEIDRLSKENERLSKEADRKAKADEEAGDFALTGSDRVADKAAARGQKDIFAKPAEEPGTTVDENDTGFIGASDEEVAEVAEAFDLAAKRQDYDKVTRVFDAPEKGEIVRTENKTKEAIKDSGYMTVKQAKQRIEEWKKNAQSQSGSRANSEKVVLSLFDTTGEWSKPWEEAGYQVYRFDIQDDPEFGDVNKFSSEFFNDLFGAFEGQDVYAILAACPCTDFASSGARHFAAKDADGRTVESVNLVQQTLATVEYFKPSVWAIENPVGRIEKLTGLPPWRLSFNPNHFGDPYTKKTLLWGRFNADLPIAPVEPTEGSKMHRMYGGKSQATKNARSVTPEGFAYAFFEANNAIDNPVMAVANKYDMLDRKAVEAAVDAGMTDQQIADVVDDPYYMDLDYDAANAALQEAADGDANISKSLEEDLVTLVTRMADEMAQDEKKRSPSLIRTLKTYNRQRNAGKMSEDMYIMMSDAAIRADEERRLKEDPKDRERGYLHIQERLSAAVRRGELSREAYDLANWFMRQNEDLVTDLGISIKGKGPAGSGGFYNAMSRVFTLIKEGGSDLTATHEILHHLERMMPTKVQQAIQKAWLDQLIKAAKTTKDPVQKLYFEAVLDANLGNNRHTMLNPIEGAGKAYADARMALEDMAYGNTSAKLAEMLLLQRAVPIGMYQYFNPSEFWAVNGSRIVQDRYDAVKGGTLIKLKNWLREFGQKIKSLLRLNSDAPVIRALDSLVKGDGKFQTDQMLSRADSYASLEGEEAPKKKELKKLGDTWLLGRDKAGKVGFGPGAKAYSAIAGIANTVLDKMAMKPVSPELGRAMRNMKARVDQVQNKIGEVAAEMNKLSKDEREMISDIIEGELKADVHPPQHVLNLAASIQSMMSRQSRELVELGMLSKEAANRWDNKYLPRFYETKLRDEVNAWAKATKDLFKKQPMMRGIKGSQLRARGLFEVIDTKDLPDYLDMGWEQRDPEFNPKTSDSTIVWRDYNRAERENMGEIRDAMFRFVMGYNASQRDIALGRLYKDLADNYASKFPLEGYVQVPETKAEGTQTPRYGKLEGLYVPKEVMDHLSANDEAMANGILKLYRAGLSKWKEGKTVLNPVSHANNVISNLTMAHFAGVSYWDAFKYGGAVKDFVTKNPMVKEAQDVGVFGGSFNNSELVKSMPPELKAMANMTESRLARFGERIWDTLAFTIEAKGTKYGARPVMQWAYEGEDMFFRYLIYRDARGRGMSPEDARDYSQEYIFTYDDLPKGARAVRDYGMPFFSYTYKVVPVLARTALVYPWRYAAPATIAYTANALMYAIAANMGGNEDDWWTTTLYRYMTDEDFRNKAKALESEERKLLPEWMKGQSAILSTPKAIRMGMDEVTKLPMFLDISRIFPGGDLLDANNNAGGVALLQPLTPSNPVLTTLVAMLANRDMFLGKDVVNKTDTEAEKAQKRAAWLWKQMTPAISVGNYHFDRAMSTIANMTGEPITIDAGPMGTVSYTGVGKDGLPVQPKHAMLQTMGIKVRPYDLELSRNIEESNRRQAVREIDLQITRINRQESKNVISSEAAQIERDKLLKKRGFISEGLTPEGKPKK